jgi:hypothetical protein
VSLPARTPVLDSVSVVPIDVRVDVEIVSELWGGGAFEADSDFSVEAGVVPGLVDVVDTAGDDGCDVEKASESGEDMTLEVRGAGDGGVSSKLRCI